MIPLDHLIDDVMLYWLTNAGPSSAHFYWEAAQEMAQGMPNAPVPLPPGISMFPGEQVRLSRRWTETCLADLRYFGEASSFSTGLKTTNSTKEDVKSSSEQALKSGRTVEETLSPEEAAFSIVAVRVMRDADQNIWLYPTAAPNWIKLKEDRFQRLVGYYDFASGSIAQTGLIHTRKFGLKTLASKS